MPGGGTALVRALPAVDQVIADLSGGVKEGGEVVRRALTYPLACIAKNSGIDPANVVEKVIAAAPGVGYNARTGELVDMIDAGVIDPVKVTYTALLNAVSVAALILNAQTLIADVSEDEDPTAGRARGGGAEKYGMN